MNEQTRGGGWLRRAFLLALVTVTGATVLALEVLGTRVIGTHYGSSLYVWAALLSVTMVCLAVGYALGGRLADRVPRAWMLYLIVLGAGGSVLLVGPLSGVIVPFSTALGLAGGAIASAAAVFVLPLTLLAMAGPYVIRLRARSLEAVGATSGAVYALSTLGSVAGVLAVSLWMIPTLGTRNSLMVCSGGLIALAAAGLALTSRGRALPLLLAAAGPYFARPAAAAVPGELYRTESPYGELRAIQRRKGADQLHRMLMVNGIMQTGMTLDIDLVARGSLLRSHDYYLELLPYYHEDLADGRRGVLIGLAGGMFPRVMDFYRMDWTAVEIDVKVAELAKAYFGYPGEIHFPGGRRHEVDLSRFPHRASPVRAADIAAHGGEEEYQAAHGRPEPYRGRAVIQDGRQYLLKNPQPADFIVLDAYNSDTIPFHLITREFFELVRSRLTEDGILAINYIGPPGGDFVTDSLFRTLGAVFGPDMLRAYRTEDDPEEVQVVIVFAFRRRLELKPWLWRGEDHEPGEDAFSRRLERRSVSTDRADGIVITDDLNPIDLARARTALRWRQRTMELLE